MDTEESYPSLLGAHLKRERKQMETVNGNNKIDCFLKVDFHISCYDNQSKAFVYFSWTKNQKNKFFFQKNSWLYKNTVL